MRGGYVTAAVLVLVGTAAGVASAQQVAYRGSAAAGRDFAVYNCDACHIVAANQELRPLIGNYAPSFFDIANKPKHIVRFLLHVARDVRVDPPPGERHGLHPAPHVRRADRRGPALPVRLRQRRLRDGADALSTPCL